MHRVDTPDADALVAALPGELIEVVGVARDLAEERGETFALVGGLVRDLLLGRDSRDLDLVVEGDGPDFARELAKRLHGRVSVHQAFLTAVVTLQDGMSIDVATARSEVYPEPASLPEVRCGSLRQDLYRRDFTINAMALRIGAEGAELLDYFGGLADLEARSLRVLHSMSFIDDPTRALRAVRLEARLGFRISLETERLIVVALAEGVFDRLTATRLRSELQRTLGEPESAVEAVQRLVRLGLLAVLHPELRMDASTRERVRGAQRALKWRELEDERAAPIQTWLLFLLALTAGISDAGRRGLAERLDLSAEDRATILRASGDLHELLRELDTRDWAPHAVAETLERRSEEERLLLLGLSRGVARRRLLRYLRQDRYLEPLIDGNDLIAAGGEPGPALGEALMALRRALLDEEVHADRASQLAFALATWQAKCEAEA